MILYPNAKINIGLNVLRKRTDGYHDIETVFYPVPVFDILEIVEGGRLTINGEIGMKLYGANCGNPGDNLCLKAYRLFREKFDLPPVEIYLHKNIPVGAGMGGGSSDAAFTLVGLNELFALNLSKDRLAEYAAVLGSDCPFFIYNVPMFGMGRGEILTPVSINRLRNFKIKIVYPPYSISTADAYKGIVPRESNLCFEYGKTDIKPGESLVDSVQKPIEDWKNYIVNDFEYAAFAKVPELASYKQRLYDEGAVYASMSGSGPAMFGIFPENRKK